MAETLKKLIEQMLFLTPTEKKKLLESLVHFNEVELKEMYLSFARLQEKENNFVKKALTNDPQLAGEVESFVAGLAPATESTKEIKKGTAHLDELLKKLS